MTARKTPAYRMLGAIAAVLVTFSLAGCGSKPSEGEIKDKLVEVFKETQMPDDQAEKMADCMAPKLHDEVSSDGLETLMDSDAQDVAAGGGGKVSKEDSDKITKIAVDCSGG